MNFAILVMASVGFMFMGVNALIDIPQTRTLNEDILYVTFSMYFRNDSSYPSPCPDLIFINQQLLIDEYAARAMNFPYNSYQIRTSLEDVTSDLLSGTACQNAQSLIYEHEMMIDAR